MDRISAGRNIVALVQVFALSVLFILIYFDGAHATDVVLANDNFFVIHDFSNIQIPDNATDAVRAFVDAGPLSSNAVSAEDFAKVQSITSRLLQTKVHLVSNKEDANLLVQTRIYQSKDFHVRNSKREPSHGLIMISVCKFPIGAIATDCDNNEYYYFADHKAEDVFQNVFNMWLNTVFPVSQK